MKKIKQQKYKIKHPTSGYDKHIIVKDFRLPNGVIESFFVDAGRDSVQIMAFTEDQEAVLVKQFRPGTERLEVELPGGGLEPDEDILEAAERELLEETGFKGNSIKFLCKMPYSPYSTGYRHTYVATGCRKVASLDLDPNEFLTVTTVPLTAFRELLRSGNVRGTDVAYVALEELGWI